MESISQVAFVVDKGLNGVLVEPIAKILEDYDVAILGMIGYKPNTPLRLREHFDAIDQLFLADISSNCLTDGFNGQIIHLTISHCPDMDFTYLFNDVRETLQTFQHYTANQHEYRRMHTIVNTNPLPVIDHVLINYTDNEGVMIHERPSPKRNIYKPLLTRIQTTNFKKVFDALWSDRLHRDPAAANQQFLSFAVLNISKFTASDKCDELIDFLRVYQNDIDEVIINVTDNAETMQRLWDQISPELFRISRIKIYLTNESNVILDRIQLCDDDRWMAKVGSGQFYMPLLGSSTIFIECGEMEETKLKQLAKALTLLKAVIYLDILYVNDDLFYYVHDHITDEKIEITDDDETIWPNIVELTVVYNINAELILLFRHRDKLMIIRLLISEEPLDINQLQALGGNVAICTNAGVHETGRNAILCIRKIGHVLGA